MNAEGRMTLKEKNSSPFPILRRDESSPIGESASALSSSPLSQTSRESFSDRSCVREWDGR